ncbi:hypothetical protein KRX19_06465 [Cardiobacteriaceae bacterium TAE3-ERU3]|nr:hypothetical protein [Cardiobacteriaceae bacterium TAE3-ERU3]
MQDRARKFKKYKNVNFILTETHLTKIYSILKEKSSKIDNSYVVFEMEREDDFSFETDRLERILEDENAGGREISKIEIKILDDSNIEYKRTLCSVVFSKNDEIKIKINVEYENREWCLLLMDEIDSQVLRIQEKKSWFPTFIKTISKYILSFMPLSFVPLIIYLNYSRKLVIEKINFSELMSKGIDEKINFLISEKYSNDYNDFIFIFTITIILLMCFCSIIIFLSSKKFFGLFDNYVFYWGDVVNKYDKKESFKSKIKWGVIIAFVVSFISSIAVYFIF